MQQIAQTSDALMAWDTINGIRYRWWCKVCKEDGSPWLWGPTCSHVENASPGIEINKAQAWTTIEKFASEIDNPTTPANADPH